MTSLLVKSDWIADQPCPQRNGPSHNLAGLINDAPTMAPTAVRACAYRPEPGSPEGAAGSLDDLIRLYGPRATGEIQRRQVKLDSEVHVVLDTEVGHVRCEPQTTPPANYCEAESSESWPVLKSVLTPDRLVRLRAPAFNDPGRAPNDWQTYPIERYDAGAVAREPLTIVHYNYGYDGSGALTFKTEKPDA